VAEILLGRDSGWSAQQRGDGSPVPGEVIRQYVLPTALGVALAAGAYAVSGSLLLWMLPVVIGLMLAIPVAALTGQPDLGRRLRAAGLLLTPEERAPPPVLMRANALAADYADDVAADPIAMLTHTPALLDAHFRMLAQPAPRTKGDIDVPLVVALAKIDDAEDCREAASLLRGKELFAVLGNRDALQRLVAKRPMPVHDARITHLHSMP
jgi:membrane glycosyltransferase